MPWQKGQSGNPDGRRRHSVVDPVLHRAIVQEDYRRIRAGIERMLDRAAEGDIEALKWVTERMDGKARQPVEHSQDPDNPILPVLAAIDDIRKRIRNK